LFIADLVLIPNNSEWLCGMASMLIEKLKNRQTEGLASIYRWKRNT